MVENKEIIPSDQIKVIPLLETNTYNLVLHNNIYTRIFFLVYEIVLSIKIELMYFI